MMLNNITKKLFKNNIRNYILLCASIVFVISVVTAFGLLLMSSTVKNVLVDGGSSMELAISCYAILSIGAVIFIGYVFDLFLKYKSKEIGIFMSLGISKRNVKKILLKEMSYLIPLVIIIGLVLGVPLSYLSWQVFTLTVIKTPETTYSIGWMGYIYGIIFAVVIVALIYFMLTRYLKKLDIMKILKAEETIEYIRQGNIFVFLLGIIFIPVGIFLAGKNMIFGGLALLGIYIVSIQIPSLGYFTKKISEKKYYKDIMFFNMLKLKGKQYSQTIFITSLLSAIIIFALSFVISQFVAAQTGIERYNTDFIFKYRKDLNVVSSNEIDALAKKHDIQIKDFSQVDAIAMIVDGVNPETEEYQKFQNERYFISEDDFNKISGENIDIKKGMYATIVEYEGELEFEAKEKESILTNVSTRKSMKYLKQEDKVFQGLNVRNGIYIGILDNEDYKRESKGLNDKYKNTHVRFNVENWKDSYDFANELRTEIILNSPKEVGYDDFEAPIFHEFNGTELAFGLMELDPKDNAIHRWWEYNPSFKIINYQDQVVQYAVYTLLFMFIALLGFISMSIIFYVKSISSVWTDKKVYQNISCLGAKKVYIKKCITKLNLILFGVPTLIGSFAAYIFISDMFKGLKEMNTYNVAMGAAIMIIIGFIVIQIISLLITRKAVIREILNFENI
ncbi:MAG: FtsX-like permease family protein [Sarcina sp.]